MDLRLWQHRVAETNTQPAKNIVNDLVAKACAVALNRTRLLTQLCGDKIRTNEHVHIGVAVAVDEGRWYPVDKFG